MNNNSFKTIFLLSLLTIFFVFIGGLIGGRGGMVFAFILAIVMNFFSYWFSDKIVLTMYGAHKAERKDAVELYSILDELAQRTGIPTPQLYIIAVDTPNAFATGRNKEHAVVALTEGIIRVLNREELKGVIAHELSHIKNRDILIGTIAATFAGAIMLLAEMARFAAFFGGFNRDRDDNGAGNLVVSLVLAIIAPIAAVLIQMAISRSREYLADETAAHITNNPHGLASALEKLTAAKDNIPMEASPSTAHMFIINPLSGGSILRWFSTHPPIEDRVKRLRNMLIV